ncbi:hypothetical protein M0804_004146 [Polistes exclamans]|nr:hypothetical protein M0804_004146 [Polistes exclamans]
MISEKGRGSTACRCCYYWNETDGRKNGVERKRKTESRVQEQVQAWSRRLQAARQTGCPDSTEGRLLCLPRVAREKQT